MYSLFRRNILNFYNRIGDGQSRKKTAEPLLLLADLDIFEKEKSDQTDKYLNLSEIIKSIENIKNMNRYRKFNTFIREVRDMGFEFDQKGCNNIKLSKEQLLDQVELLRQCMYYTYT